MKLTIEVIRSFGLNNRKTYEALLRLAEDREDAAALIVIFEENREPIKAAVRRWLGNESKYEEAAKDVLLRIGEEAHSFDRQTEDARDFVFEWANLECRRLRLQLQLDAAASN
jgi:DNA-directed RNA polymerase specialized sigma24 family protein